MKKSILTLFILLVCTIQTATAYEYFTIYFSNGTKSEAFYATDVDSICYSKLSLDSIIYDDWQVQEIYTCDSIYRYPLAQIDSLSFKDVDENKVAEDIAQVSSILNPMFLQCSSSEELAQQIPNIDYLDGVEKVWSDNQSLFIKFRDCGVMSYSYPPHSVPTFNIKKKLSGTNRKMVRQSMNINGNITHKHIDVKNVCVIRQMAKDWDYTNGIAESDSIIKMCQDWGLSVNVNDNLQPDFFVNGIRQYDLVFLMTHGLYNGSHWLATNEEIYSQTLNKPVNGDSLRRVAKEFIKTKYYDNGYSPNDVNFSHLIENRNGQKTLVCYTWISNHFISKHKTPKSNNVVVFNAACQSMKGNPELADEFINTGAVCYTGFTESNSIGPWTNSELCEYLLSGFSIYGAYNALPDELYEETVELPKKSGKYVYPKLILWPENKEQTSICITHPETMPAEIVSNEGETQIKLKGTLKTINHGILNKIGIDISKDPTMLNSDSTHVTLKPGKNNYLLTIEATLSESQLDPNTTYYYRAYMNDGYSNCYGGIKQFTTKGNAEAYVVLVDSTLTFYYDSKMSERTGGKIYLIKDNYSFDGVVDLPSWRFQSTKVVFDPSFAGFAPTSTAYWFISENRLKSIENLNYLNTTNVTNMRCMFSGCSSLTSLDLSSFNTANVTDMRGMFSDCSSLSSLDLSNFNTANVTNMLSMFGGCSSLTNINLSSFNTANVTDMNWMFNSCKSLKNLDLSSFNTANVTDMHSMFSGCSSLTSLDLSSFNTANVRDMSWMFYECRSLTNLVLSSFNTANVTNMRGMFGYCSSLTNLNLSSFNTANVRDMSWMFYECRFLTNLDLSSFNMANAWVADMFYECSSLTDLNCRNLVLAGGIGANLFKELKNLKHIDLSNVNTSEATEMWCMFSGCSSLTSLDLSSFNTANVTNMGGMFDGCSSLTSLDLSSFNTANVTNMVSLFDGCSSLTSLDLSNFNTAKVTNMQSMFSGCSSLTSLDLNSFNTANVTNMAYMFWGCSSLTSLNLSSFNTANVTDMDGMFVRCSSLRSLDLSSFNTANARGWSMFSGCSSLRIIYAGNWKDMGLYLFKDCKSLVGGKGTKIGNNLYGYDKYGNPLYYYCSDSDAAAHIDGGKDNPGLFTAK